MTFLFNLTLAICVAALVVAVLQMVLKRAWLHLLVTALLTAAAVVLTVYMGVRWAEAGRPPFSNMFESMTLFAWAVLVIHLAFLARLRLPIMAAASALACAAALAYASAFFETDIRPLVPALQSNWLTFHVFTCFLGYGGFAVSFLASMVYLVTARAGSTVSAETNDTLEELIAKTVSFGFLFLTLGIITGAVWANSAWGTYWSWDPKETWSLITWFVYAIFLHCRFMRGWRGRRAAWISIAGFVSVLFTYIGVNFLMSGLHSYA